MHACAHIVCGNGNTAAKIYYLTLTMQIFAAVRLFFLFCIFIAIYKFFLYHASLRYEKISEHIFLPDNAIIETYTMQEGKTVDFISRIKILNAIDYRVKRIMWMLGPL
jgi:hypothetical protein